MLAVVAPGQGSLRPGTLAEWGRHDVVGERLSAAADLVGADLARLGPSRRAGHGDGAPTSLVQPAAVALAHGAWTAVADLAEPAAGPSGRALPTLLAGHSIGEVSVAAVGGALDGDDAVRLAHTRGTAMDACATASPTSMLAVTTLPRRGTDAAEVEAVQQEIIAVAARDGVSLAVHNGASQVVLGGPAAAVAVTREQLARGPYAGRGVVVRATELTVDAAFHTAAMLPASAALEAAVADLVTTRPHTTASPASGPWPGPGPTYLSGIDGTVTDAVGLVSRLPRAVVAPVRWDLVMATLAAHGVTGVLELPPGGALAGLLRRRTPAPAVLALETPDDLDAAARFVVEHRAGDPAAHPRPDHPGDTG